MSSKTMIQVNNIGKNYGPVQAIQNASFQVHDGEIIALLGPNGAGKTTMMKILTGFMEPSHGSVLIDGMDIQQQKLEIQKIIGYLP